MCAPHITPFHLFCHLNGSPKPLDTRQGGGPEQILPTLPICPFGGALATLWMLLAAFDHFCPLLNTSGRF